MGDAPKAISDEELQRLVDEGKVMFPERELQFRQDIIQAQGLFRANAAARVHVDAVAANSPTWCDDVKKLGEQHKQQALNDAGAKLADTANSLSNWRLASPYVITKLPESETDQGRQLIYDEKSFKQVSERPSDDYAFDNLSTADAVRYKQCVKFREEGADAREKYDAAEADYAKAWWAEHAAQADDAYARINGETPVSSLDQASYLGLKYGEGALEGASVMPVVGTPASLTLSGLYYASGENTSGTLALLGAVPGEGALAKGLGKLGDKAGALIGRQAVKDAEALARMSPAEAEKAMNAAKLSPEAKKALEDAVKKKRAEIEKREAAIKAKRKGNKEGEHCFIC